MNDPIPAHISADLLEFLRAKKSGTLALDIRDGSILGARWQNIVILPPRAVAPSSRSGT